MTADNRETSNKSCRRSQADHRVGRISWWNLNLTCGTLWVSSVRLKFRQFSPHQQKNSHPTAQKQDTTGHPVKWGSAFFAYAGARHASILDVPDPFDPCPQSDLDWVVQQWCESVHPALNQRVPGSSGHRAPGCLLPTQTEERAGRRLQNGRARVELQRSAHLRHQAGHRLRKRGREEARLKYTTANSN